MVLESVWNKILSLGNLSFLGFSDKVVAVGLTRLLIGILIFTFLYTAGVNLGNKGIWNFNRNQTIVVALVLAIISSIFIPPSVLLAAGAGWATIVALLLIGGPVVGIATLFRKIPGEGKEETKSTVLLKIILCLLLFWILTVSGHYLGSGFGEGMVVEKVRLFIEYALIIIVFMLFYYVIKFFLVLRPSKEEREAALEERREAVKEFIKKKVEEMKKAETEQKITKRKKRKKALITPIKIKVIKAIEACEEVLSHLSLAHPSEIEKIKRIVRTFDKEIKAAWKNLRSLRRNLEGKEREEIDKLILRIETIKVNFQEELKEKLFQKVSSTSWRKQISAARNSLSKIKASCGALLKELESFPEK